MTDIEGGYDPTMDDEPCFGADQDCDCGNCAIAHGGRWLNTEWNLHPTGSEGSPFVEIVGSGS